MKSDQENIVPCLLNAVGTALTIAVLFIAGIGGLGHKMEMWYMLFSKNASDLSFDLCFSTQAGLMGGNWRILRLLTKFWSGDSTLLLCSDLIDGRALRGVTFVSLVTRNGSDPTENGWELPVLSGRFRLSGEQSRRLRTSC